MFNLQGAVWAGLASNGNTSCAPIVQGELCRFGISLGKKLNWGCSKAANGKGNSRHGQLSFLFPTHRMSHFQLALIHVLPAAFLPLALCFVLCAAQSAKYMYLLALATVVHSNCQRKIISLHPSTPPSLQPCGTMGACAPLGRLCAGIAHTPHVPASANCSGCHKAATCL